MRAPHTIEIAAFHGTKHRFETFEASPRGHFGSGIYMADRKAAEEYAGPDGIVMSLAVTLARPYHYAATLAGRHHPDRPAAARIRRTHRHVRGLLARDRCIQPASN